MKVQTAALAVTVALATISIGCGSASTLGGAGGSTSASGGNGPGTGGTSATGGTTGGSCSNGTSCGGNVVGTWTVDTSCLALGGNLDITNAGLDPRSCTNVKITGPLTVTGSFTAAADGTYTDNTKTSGTAKIEMPSGCLNISGTTTTCVRISGPLQGLGFASASCVDAASGGGCTCTATIDQTGGLGAINVDPSTTGNYTTSGGTLVADGATNYSYCIANNQLTLTPKPMALMTTGTVVLKSGSGSGSGGTIGGTGGTPAGGHTGTGGTSSGGAGGRGGGATGGNGGKPGTGGTAGTTAATGGTGGGSPAGAGPCDIYATAGTPCVAAYSMVRVLNTAYTGPLYQVRKGSSTMNTGTGGTTMDILSVGGYGDAASQDTFCSGSVCTVSIIYDQSGKGNHLKVAPAGCYNDGSANTPDYESSATKRVVMINGHKTYALYMNAHEGYRNNKTTGMPLMQTAEGIYEIADGKRIGAQCCWDFGNAGTDNCNGSVMNTIFFGTGFWGSGAPPGPWFLGDFEGGVWAGGSGASNANNPMNPSMSVDYAVGILKTSGSGSSAQYAIRVANGQSGGITTAYDGKSPKGWDNKGGIILGIGGDNSNHSLGTFFEGAITTGRPSDATDALVVANIQAANYGK